MDEPPVVNDKDAEFEQWWDEQTRNDETEYRHKKLLRAVDITAASLLILCILVSAGAYFRITQWVVLSIVVFIVIRALLALGTRTKVKQVIKQILRTAAIAVSVCYLLVLLPFDTHAAFLYPVRRTLFEVGEYNIGYLHGLPDKLPAETDGFSMKFISNTIFPNDREYVTLTFITDSEGIGQIRAKAQSLSTENPQYGDFRDKAEVFIDGLCTENGLDGSGLDIYTFPPDDLSGTGYVYAVSEASGLCIIHWERHLF